MKNENTYETKDLYFSAFLFSKKTPLLNLRKDSQKDFYWFVFSHPTQCSNYEREFWSGKAKVEVITYLNALKTLKNRLGQRGLKERN